VKKFYAGGAWADRARVNAIIKELSAEGYECVLDWTEDSPDSDKIVATNFKRMANRDIEAIVTAAQFGVFIHDDSTRIYRGSYCELGACLARGIHCFVLIDRDGANMRNVFHHHDLCHVLHADPNVSFVHFILARISLIEVEESWRTIPVPEPQ